MKSPRTVATIVAIAFAGVVFISGESNAQEGKVGAAVNDAMNPVPAATLIYARQPVHIQQILVMLEGRKQTGMGKAFTVPKGKRLVIEEAYEGLGLAAPTVLSIQTSVGGRKMAVAFPFPGDRISGAARAGPMRVYADPVTNVSVQLGLDTVSPGSVAYIVQLSGYLVPLGSPSLAP